MKIEDQVCTVEQSETLVKLGVKGDSYFNWSFCHLGHEDGGTKEWIGLFRPNSGEYDIMPVGEYPERYDGEEFESYKDLPAFTVAELGVMLELHCQNKISFIPHNKKWLLKFEHATRTAPERNYGTGTTVLQNVYGTEAEARCDLLIYMIENDFLTVEDVNNHLIP